MNWDIFLMSLALTLGFSCLGIAFFLYILLDQLQDRVSRVTQHLAEESAGHSAEIESLVDRFEALQEASKAQVANAEHLIALANARVTDARGLYGDAQMMRDNAMRRIEKWDAHMEPLVAAMDKFKDRVERQSAAMRKDLDAVISAQAASAGALTKKVKSLDHQLSSFAESQVKNG